VVIREGTAEASGHAQGTENREEETTVLFGRTDQSDAGILQGDPRQEIYIII